jgi:hypothetical protein
MQPTRQEGPELVAGLRQNIYRYLETEPELAVYVLLDCNRPVAETHELHPTAIGKREFVCPTHRVGRADLEHDPQACPLLLTLRPTSSNGYPDEELVDLLTNCAQERAASINGAFVAGWLLSSSEPSAVAEHLARASVMFDLLSGRRRALPYFEPHRMALIHAETNSSGKDMVSPLLGPIAHWFYVDAIGELQCASRSGETLISGASLDLVAWHAQGRVHEARFVLTALVKTQAMIPRLPEQAIDRAVKSAHEQGLRELEDVVFFSLNCFTLASAWFAHPAARAAIRNALENKTLLADCMRQLDDAELEAIASYR